MILGMSRVKKSFGIDEILTDVTFTLEDREKAAVVGVNGAGKTTVFRLVTGESEADDGEIIRRKGMSVGYLPQTAEFESDGTIMTELSRVFGHVARMEEALREMEREMAGMEGAELEEHMEKYSALTHKFESAGGYEYGARVRRVIKGLGFDESEWDKPVAKLSGGQKTRVALGKLLLTEPDLLLLDEPTNHLDIASVEWLEDYLKTYGGAMLIISHDRYFLDRVTTKTIEIENKKSSVYNGGYSFYAKHKEIDRAAQMKRYLDQQKIIKKQEDFIRLSRNRATVDSIKAAKSREHMLEHMEREEKPESLPDKMRLILKPRVESGHDVLFADNMGKSFGGKRVFGNVSFKLTKGETVALVGANGVGKTTLLKALQNHLPHEGFARWGVNVKIGYYDQEHGLLDSERSIIDEIREDYPRLTTGQIRNVLAAFVFTGDDVFKPLSALSGGEKGRVALAKIMLGGANTLLLDEPTNHLDMYSKEILEETLRDFPGTVFYVSHDRYFINNTADRVLEMDEHGVTAYLGNYDAYLEKKAETEPLPAVKKISEPSRGKAERVKKKSDADAERRRKAEKTRLEREIAKAEARIAEVDALLADEETGSDHEQAARLFDEKTALEEGLLERYARYEDIVEEE